MTRSLTRAFALALLVLALVAPSGAMAQGYGADPACPPDTTRASDGSCLSGDPQLPNTGFDVALLVGGGLLLVGLGVVLRRRTGRGDVA